ncbi:WD40 repeat domain-containing protein [Fimbriiglobus ruber]|uniref:High-affnity carbon uptake protein Hat/HatR n=1 Tax=Fimbriiglobus ruber TaxID=1908690 RepID=A0A225DKL1_9BACT|nr:WD40 repeat domain-containing protein [Fimbriiglobus ruber]OWK40184.1 High-affnity carbon uptake protein Hat/HatR [Fimbriiglobus ruber]
MTKFPAFRAVVVAAGVSLATPSSAQPPPGKPTVPQAAGTQQQQLQQQRQQGRRGPRAEPATVLLTLGDPLKHWDVVRAVAFSPDGKWFASASDDGSVKLKDAATGKEAHVFAANANRLLSAAFYAVAFSPDSKTLAAASADKTIRLWDVATGALKVTLAGHRDAVAGIAFRPDGKVLATASDDRTVRFWDVEKPTPDPVPRAGIPGVTEPPIKELKVIDQIGDFAAAVAWSPDGKWVAVGLWDQTVQLWDAESGVTKHVLKGHTARISSLAFTPDSRTLVSSALEPIVRTWTVADGKAGPTLSGHAGPVFAVAVGHDGAIVATAGHDGTVRLWSAGDGKPVRTAATHTGAALSVAFSADAGRVASGGSDAAVRFTPVDPRPTGSVTAGNLIAAAYSPDGKFLTTGDDAGAVRVWDADTGRELRAESVGAKAVTAVAAGRRVIAGGADGKVTLLPLSGDDKPVSLAGHKDAVRAVALSPDGSLAASGSADKTIILWDAEAGKLLRTLSGHDGVVTSVVFTPDGKSVVSTADDRGIKVWDVADGRLVRTLDPDEDDDPLAVAIRPDGKQLASVGNRDVPPTVKLWDPATGATQRTLPGHLDRPLAAAYRANSQVLATVAADGTLRLWNPTTGKSLQALILRRPRGTISQVVFHPKGDRVATVNGNGTVTVIKLPDLSEAPTATASANNN